MNKKHIIRILDSGNPSCIYTMTEKEDISIDIIIVSSVSFDAEFRLNLNVAGATATIRCILLPSDGITVSFCTYQTHTAAQTKSDLLVKTVVADASTVNIKENVYIGKHAKQSDAYQKNENLVIGDGGVVVTSPILEIENYDVRCSHGVATGAIPEDVLWYMKTRGLSDKKAKELYVERFVRGSMNIISGTEIEDVIYNQLKKYSYGE